MAQHVACLVDGLSVKPDDQIAALEPKRARMSLGGCIPAQTSAEGAAMWDETADSRMWVMPLAPGSE
jgi:hypothetical protein